MAALLLRSERRRLAFSVNKRKSLEAAQKYFQKGQYDRALKEYLKHLEAEPDDANARLKLAELHRKLKDNGAAIDAYNQVAQQFSRSGFDAKAAAIYRQILKVDETSLDARIRLADHCQRMGLTSEALRELQVAIRMCQERGLKREAFDLLKRLADLDPSNIPNRLHLADLLVREGLGDEAQDEFSKLLEQAQRDGALDVVVRVAQQMLGCFPDSERALQAYAGALVKAGQVQEALTRILQALPKFPNSIPVREALIGAYQARGDHASAQTTYRDIAEIYKRRGDHEQARDILQRFVPVEGLGTDELDSSPSIVLGQSKVPTSIGDWGDESAFEPPPSRPLSGAKLGGGGGGGGTQGVEELVAEARVARDFNDADAARVAAERALVLDPENRAAREILQWVRDEAPSADDESEPDASVPDLDDEDLQLVLDQTADKLGLPSKGSEWSVADDASTLPNIELVLVDTEQNDDPNDWSSVDPPTVVQRQRAERAGSKGTAPAAPPRGPAVSAEEFEIDLDDLDLAESLSHGASPQDGRDEVLPLDEPPELGAPAAARTAARPAAAASDSASGSVAGPSATWAQQSSWIGKTIDAADAILAQGLHAQAEVLYKQVLTHAPNHPQALLRLGEIAAKYGKDPGGESGEFDLSALEDTSVDSDSFVGARIEKAASDDEFLEFSQIGLAPLDDETETDARQVAAGPAAARVQPAVPSPGVSDEPAEFEFDVELDDPPAAPAPAAPLAAAAEMQLATLLDPEDLEGALEGIGIRAGRGDEVEDGFDLAAALNEGAGAGSAAPRIQDVFRAFKKGIEAQIGDEEWSAHYDLAIAYREMGLLEDAVEQLGIVARGRGLGLDGIALLATCKIELGVPEDAIKLLGTALERDQEPLARTALQYDLAEAYLASGNRPRALEAFRVVQQLEPEYREVQKRVAELS